ncbi:glycine--tRNA ligase beta subunit [Thalassobaculum fulvum]|uniref:Glycine--tRNA ligase beta subunit n=1 Tax=Thalassobaculum fulvum TaxID=1633335 RepID=A0A919CQD4_9PROT|nr:glycine--tRNA ligase subunit beta [Thalassobaculum fulvum]GHD54707.1 glycine--tRNA ligase beta subunit [Thalassobaculum fulvum]
MAELLVELFSEEIPARMQARAAEDLKGLVTAKLKAAGLGFASAEAHVTPRRLALAIDGLPARQPDRTEERKGPKVGSPDKAVQGFLKGAGLESIDQAEIRATDKGDFYFAVRHIAGAPLETYLPYLLFEAISEMPWPKSMRWGRNDFRWVRPLHSILAIVDGKPLDLDFHLLRTKEEAEAPTAAGTIRASNTTRGHRFLAPEPFAVGSFADYKAKLKDACVILDREERKRIIADGIAALAAEAGLVFKGDPGLLEEVCGLVEWPVPMLGRIDDQFMGVPKEVLVTSMRSHQKYFALETADGALADRFAVVANMASEPKRDANIVAGNEKVLRARLSDAKFFWDQDRKVRLADRRAALQDVKFYESLGTIADKVERFATLAAEIAGRIGADPELARHAATLSKADLTTGMVGEFPELQGIMGRYYALDSGEDPAVADAIAEHYSPLGPSDTCPTAPVSVAVALADKMDTLVGFFAIDERPTGSKDPFALRRAALGVIRLILENDLRLPLAEMLASAYWPIANHVTGFERFSEHLGQEDGESSEQGALLSCDDVVAALLAFFADRLKVHLREQGVRHDLIAAVFELGGEDDLVRLLARVHALADFLGTDDGANLLTGFRRAANIVRIEEKKDGRTYESWPEISQFAAFSDPNESAEVELMHALGEVDEKIEPLLVDEKFTDAMRLLATLRGPVDRYFEKVTVNDADATRRENRLRFLSSIVRTMNQVADFSKIEG